MKLAHPRGLRHLVWMPLAMFAQDAHAAPPAGPADAPPAIGYDWIDPHDAGAHDLGPEIWPRGDEAAAGLDDMILDERNAIVDHDSARGPGVVRFARRVTGDYVVVPVFRMHFRRGG